LSIYSKLDVSPYHLPWYMVGRYAPWVSCFNECLIRWFLSHTGMLILCGLFLVGMPWWFRSLTAWLVSSLVLWSSRSLDSWLTQQSYRYRRLSLQVCTAYCKSQNHDDVLSWPILTIGTKWWCFNFVNLLFKVVSFTVLQWNGNWWRCFNLAIFFLSPN
jgi:hypothetical protein